MKLFKIYFFGVLLLCSSVGLAQDCPTSLLVLSTQQEIDNFSSNYPNCTELPASLKIEGNNITNLDGLSQLEMVWSLQIENCPSLVNVDGLLENLEVLLQLRIVNNNSLERISCSPTYPEVTSGIYIASNQSLTTISGFNNIEEIGVYSQCEGLEILNNPNLVTISGFNFLKEVCELKFKNNGLINLPSFQSLITVNKSIEISNNNQLQSIDAFSNLVRIEQYFSIKDNQTLQSISAGQSFFKVGRNFEISGNPSLTTVNGFDSNFSVTENFTITNNENLLSLPRFDILSSVGESLLISNNPQLQGIVGFANLDNVKSLEISNNSSLTEFDAFEDLEDIENDFEVSGSPNLEEIIGFNSLNAVGRNFYLYDLPSLASIAQLPVLEDQIGHITIQNTQLQNIDFLENQTTLYDLKLIDNPLLTSVAGVRNITTVRTLHLENLPISNLNDFSQLINVGGALSLVGLNITDVDVFSSIDNLNGSLDIKDNPNLENLEGFTNLTRLGYSPNGYLQVDGNAILSSASGLDNLDPTSFFSVSFENNPNLSVCNVQSVCEFLQVNQSYNLHHIENNAPGCANAIEVAESCGFVLGVTNDEISEITMYPNPAEEMLFIGGIDEGTIEFVDAAGRIVYTTSKVSSIDVSNLQSGVYFVKIYIDGKVLTKKIIKE